MRHVLRLRHGKAPSEQAVKDWFTRIRALASGLSTSRMAFRLIKWIENIKFLLEELKKYLNGLPLDDSYNWLTNVLDLIGGIADNWFYLCRVSGAHPIF